MTESTAAHIDVWQIPLGGTHDVGSLAASLDCIELGYAQRLVNEELRARYILAHGRLRQILAGYVDTPPDQVSMVRPLCHQCGKQHAKPVLNTTVHRQGFRFNLAHTHDLALVAVARSVEVGIDVENVDRSSLEHLINFLSPDEEASVNDVTPGLRARMILRYWVRKEAYLKGTGEGLRTVLSTIDVSRDRVSRDPASSVDTCGSWRLLDVCVGTRHVAAVATPRVCTRVVTIDWHDDEARHAAWKDARRAKPAAPRGHFGRGSLPDAAAAA